MRRIRIKGLSNHNAGFRPFARVLNTDNPSCQCNGATFDCLVHIMKSVCRIPNVMTRAKYGEPRAREARGSLDLECPIAGGLNRDVFLEPVSDGFALAFRQQPINDDCCEKVAR